MKRCRWGKAEIRERHVLLFFSSFFYKIIIYDHINRNLIMWLKLECKKLRVCPPLNILILIFFSLTDYPPIERQFHPRVTTTRPRRATKKIWNREPWPVDRTFPNCLRIRWPRRPRSITPRTRRIWSRRYSHRTAVPGTAKRVRRLSTRLARKPSPEPSTTSKRSPRRGNSWMSSAGGNKNREDSSINSTRNGWRTCNHR